MDLLQANRKVLDELAMYLYDKETITGEEFMNFLSRYQSEGTLTDAEAL